MVDDIPTLINFVHGGAARGAILQGDLTLTPCYIARLGNVYAHGDTLREAIDACRDKLFDDMPAEERAEAFVREHEPGKLYPVKEFYAWHNRLTGSCEAGRRAFAKDHGIDIERGEMSVEEFLSLTRNAYGGEVIREAERLYRESGALREER